MSRPMVGSGLAGCCTVLSIMGVIFLAAIGAAFEHNVEVLTGSIKFEGDGPTVAKNCYAAAVVYACFVGFCGCQIGMNRRYARGAVRI
ncbi:hypothetical protein MNV49_001059 [Pseudohyphozyma bogoriensis]|nr:hypothetical protein MNV49_001059 [Pseudohyphozyma bogoriensis]